MLLKRWAFGYFFASTFLFGMMFAELSHFLQPVHGGWHVPLHPWNVHGYI
jgi:hypothetical protein